MLDIFKTRSLGRAAVTLFRHSTGHKLLFLGLSMLLAVDSFQVYEYFDVASSRNLFRKVGELIVNRDEDLEVN